MLPSVNVHTSSALWTEETTKAVHVSENCSLTSSACIRSINVLEHIYRQIMWQWWLCVIHIDVFFWHSKDKHELLLSVFSAFLPEGWQPKSAQPFKLNWFALIGLRMAITLARSMCDRPPNALRMLPNAQQILNKCTGDKNARTNWQTA